MKITTAHLLADKALQVLCGQQCVDWAIGMLEEGRDGQNLSMLAGMLPPFNHFELSAIRDRALHELGIPDIDGSLAVRTYAAERLRMALAGQSELIEVTRQIKDLCISSGYSEEIYDFYLLYFAYEDLLTYGSQHYWNGATQENIVSIIHQRAEKFVRDFGQPTI